MFYITHLFLIKYSQILKSMILYLLLLYLCIGKLIENKIYSLYILFSRYYHL